MRYYLDTEFDEENVKLISIGVVAQDGREFYAVNTEYDWNTAHDWLVENVMPHLVIDASATIQGSAAYVGSALISFIGDDHEVEFWGYKCAWDIVLVHLLFGGYNTISRNCYPIPLVCNDLTQFARSVGIESLKEKVPPFEPAHNALTDAKWNRHVHNMMIVQYGRAV